MESENSRGCITYKELKGQEEQHIASIYGNQLKFIKANPGSIIFPSTFALVGDKIQNFKVRPDDIWILAYPRTGSNWLQEMVWLIGHDLNFEEAKKTQLCFRSVLLEGTAVSGHLYGEWGTKPDNTITLLGNIKSPRHIKSHLPWTFLPNELETQKPKDIKGSILKIAEFLGKHMSDENVKELADHLSFQNMSKNRAVNREDIMEALAGPDHKSILTHGFLRKGDVGDWRNHMSHETAMKFDTWTEQNLRGTGLSFE
ncbi:hypothetical protein C0J52_00308 [Blattella germanica]|nr:hypothetical protein C0J52_00308 [Blattella germanica]